MSKCGPLSSRFRIKASEEYILDIFVLSSWISSFHAPPLSCLFSMNFYELNLLTQARNSFQKELRSNADCRISKESTFWAFWAFTKQPVSNGTFAILWGTEIYHVSNQNSPTKHKSLNVLNIANDCRLSSSSRPEHNFLEDIFKTKEIERSWFEREATPIHLALCHI